MNQGISELNCMNYVCLPIKKHRVIPVYLGTQFQNAKIADLANHSFHRRMERKETTALPCPIVSFPGSAGNSTVFAKL